MGGSRAIFRGSVHAHRPLTLCSHMVESKGSPHHSKIYIISVNAGWTTTQEDRQLLMKWFWWFLQSIVSRLNYVWAQSLHRSEWQRLVRNHLPWSGCDFYNPVHHLNLWYRAWILYLSTKAPTTDNDSLIICCHTFAAFNLHCFTGYCFLLTLRSRLIISIHRLPHSWNFLKLSHLPVLLDLFA